jgi:hypothetical protein
MRVATLFILACSTTKALPRRIITFTARSYAALKEQVVERMAVRVLPQTRG